MPEAKQMPNTHQKKTPNNQTKKTTSSITVVGIALLGIGPNFMTRWQRQRDGDARWQRRRRRWLAAVHLGRVVPGGRFYSPGKCSKLFALVLLTRSGFLSDLKNPIVNLTKSS